jgi:tagatose-1,6-bisphosphate aldolase
MDFPSEHLHSLNAIASKESTLVSFAVSQRGGLKRLGHRTHIFKGCLRLEATSLASSPQPVK